MLAKSVQNCLMCVHVLLFVFKKEVLFAHNAHQSGSLVADLEWNGEQILLS